MPTELLIHSQLRESKGDRFLNINFSIIFPMKEIINLLSKFSPLIISSQFCMGKQCFHGTIGREKIRNSSPGE